MATVPVALLDASVLYPALLCDTLLRAAEAELYRPHWSASILDELDRNLAPRIGSERARLRIMRMQRAFPEAEVTGYEQLIDGLPNHVKDRHVLTAAIIAEAHVIVTENLRHFRPNVLTPLAIEGLSADSFLIRLFQQNPEALIHVVREQAAAYHRPPLSVLELVEHLERFVPMLAARLISSGL